MILLELFWGFLRVGMFSFGGAYAAIPLIREVVLSYGWLTDDEISYMIAVGESTPGPIMVNLATFVGSSQGGVLGALIATFAEVLPAFVIMLLVMAALKNLLQNRYVQAAIRGLEAGVVGVILAVGLWMLAGNLFPGHKLAAFDLRALCIGAVLTAILLGAAKLRRRLSPIALIGIAAVLGAVVYAGA